MARIKLGALITEMSGSIGGFSVQKNHYGTSLKVKNNPIRSISQSQSMRRGEISSLIPLWQNLTEAQRLQWNNYTSYNRQTAKNNSDSLLSGYNLFLKYNVLRLYAGLSVILSPSYGLSNFVNTLPLSITNSSPHFLIASGFYPPDFIFASSVNNWVSSAIPVFDVAPMKIVSNGIISVAVGGSNNSLAYSYDNSTWYGLGNSIFADGGKDCIFDGVKFIACGSGANSFAYSYDGLTWIGLGKQSFSSAGYSLCWNGHIYVASGQGTHTLAYSYDGLTWIGLGASHITSLGFSVIFNGNIFIACGIGAPNLSYSSDGITWHSSTVPSVTFLYSIAYSGSIYVLSCYGDYQLAYSSDLITWYFVSTPEFLDYSSHVIWNGYSFIAVGGFNTSNILISSDGINWAVPAANGSSNDLTFVSCAPDPLQIPVISILTINFSNNINASQMYCIVKSSMPLSSPNSILHKKRRIIPDITLSANGISLGSNFISVWGRNPAAGEWLTIEITFFSLVSSIVYKPVTQLCQLT